MLKSLIFISLFFPFVLTVQEAYCQTSIRGKVLSADGSTLPKTVISIRPENPRDIFDSYYEDVLPDEDGSYQLLIREPGIYWITFRGIFHHSLTIPVLIYDQSLMQMDILLLPGYYNDGAYFGNDEYLKWVRIYGNFNKYSFDDGRPFSLNDDGSISAFIPVTSDTIRYQVRGLTYGRGPTTLPQADEYHYNENYGFESVLYKDLPEDSLEIRYTPGQNIPYKRHLPEDVNPQKIVLRGFISFENREDQYWVEPLRLIRSFYVSAHVVDRKFSSGVPADTQIEIQKQYLGGVFNTDPTETEEQILSDLNKPDLHPQQHVLLRLAYAGVLSMKHRKKFFGQQFLESEDTTDIIYDVETVIAIPDIVPPAHPAWSLNPGLADALLTITEPSLKFENYFNKIVKHHPNEQAVRSVALTLIRLRALDYTSVERIPVYQSIIERYGEGNLARDAHRLFDSLHLEQEKRDN